MTRNEPTSDPPGEPLADQSAAEFAAGGAASEDAERSRRPGAGPRPREVSGP